MNSTSDQELLYQALDITKRQIRLIDIVPIENTGLDLTKAESDDTGIESELHQISLEDGSKRSVHAESIQCHMRVVSLDDKPQYESWSYVWGDETDKVSILVNGRPLEVTSNLERMLRIAATSEGARKDGIWVDAICIEQQNVQEKSSQVGLMKGVYTSAQTVKMWVYFGDVDNPDIDPDAATGDKSESEVEEVDWDAGFRLMDDWYAVCYEDKSKLDPDIDLWNDQGWEALHKLVGSQYWRRVWIIQEVAQAENPMMVCGRRECPFINLSVIARYWGEFWNTATGLNEPLNYAKQWYLIDRIQSLRWIRENDGQPATFFDNLSNMGCSCSATDPRDKVYAMLGISMEPFVPIEPDYDLDTAGVYISAMKTAMQLTNTLDYIVYAGLAASMPSDKLEKPTWCWDLRQDQRVSGTPIDVYLTSGKKKPVFRFQDQDKTLVSRGIIVDGVTEVVAFPHCDFDDATYETESERPCVQKLRALFDRQPEIYPNGAPKYQAFFRNWVCDTWCIISKCSNAYDLAENSNLSSTRAHGFLLSLQSCLPRQNTNTIPDETVIRLTAGDISPKARAFALDSGIVPSDTEGIYDASVLVPFTGLPGDPFFLDTASPCDDETAAAHFLTFFATHWYCEYSFFATKAGYMGLAMGEIQEGDVIAVLYGLSVPMVLRKTPEEGQTRYQVVCFCYCYGMMEGEMIDKVKEGIFTAEDIEIV